MKDVVTIDFEVVVYLCDHTVKLREEIRTLKDKLTSANFRARGLETLLDTARGDLQYVTEQRDTLRERLAQTIARNADHLYHREQLMKRNHILEERVAHIIKCGQKWEANG